MTPRPGDIVFVRGNGWMSKAIRQITGGKYNHVEIYVGNGEAVGAMEGTGIRKIALTEYAKEGSTYCFGRVVNLPDYAAKAIADRILTMQGAPYDLLGLFGIWLKFACKWAGIRWIVFWGKNKASDEFKGFCSKVVGNLHLALGYRFGDNDPSWLTPTEIYESSNVVPFGESNE